MTELERLRYEVDRNRHLISWLLTEQTTPRTVEEVKAYIRLYVDETTRHTRTPKPNEWDWIEKKRKALRAWTDSAKALLKELESK